MAIRTKRTRCVECGNVTDHSYDTDAGRCPEQFACECGGVAEWWFQPAQNHIHTERPSLYDRQDQFGGVDPRFGVRVTSYQEKKAILKERGLEETEVERYDDIQNEVAERQERQNQHQRDPNMLVADSLDEINQKISKQAVGMGAAEDFSKREGYNKETGLIENEGLF